MGTVRVTRQHRQARGLIFVTFSIFLASSETKKPKGSKQMTLFSKTKPKEVKEKDEKKVDEKQAEVKPTKPK